LDIRDRLYREMNCKIERDN